MANISGMLKPPTRQTCLFVLLIVTAILSVLPYVRPDWFRRQPPGTSGIYGRYLAERWAQTARENSQNNL